MLVEICFAFRVSRESVLRIMLVHGEESHVGGESVFSFTSHVGRESVLHLMLVENQFYISCWWRICVPSHVCTESVFHLMLVENQLYISCWGRIGFISHVVKKEDITYI